jgi:hypothetical protein
MANTQTFGIGADSSSPSQGPTDSTTTAIGASGSQPTSVGGIMNIKSLASMQAAQKAQAEEVNSSPIVTGLAGHVKQCWTWARMAKQQTVEERILQSIRQRRGHYDPMILAKIQEQGGSQIYMNLTSVKCRGAVSWLRDVFLSTSNDKPWTLAPTPIPDLPPEYQQSVIARATKQIAQAVMQGQLMPDEDVQEMLVEMKADQLSQLQDEAKEMVGIMEQKMADQLDEGGFTEAFSQFLDDLVTFPSAIIKGPIVSMKPRLKWVPDATPDATPSPLGGNPDQPAQPGPQLAHPTKGGSLQVVNELVLEWKRVDPFRAYPAPNSNDINDSYFIEHHQLNRQDLQDMIGVPGYSDDAIRAVLDDYGRGGLRLWLTHEMLKAQAEGKLTTAISYNEENLIDALQYWGSVQGRDLLDWGMTAEEVPDPLKEYHCEVWVIGRWVIKVTLNYDPCHRKPYYKTSYETVPGTFWGNSVCDLVRDCATMCNNAARALANNMGIASGPQVSVNVERVPAGADVTEIYPWKVWQTTSDPMGSTVQALQFFQPDDRSAELMKVFEEFSELADEYSGVPRYMTGTDGTPGAGRTASGLSMMINNAGKVIKQVINNVDSGVITPLLDRLYFYNMRYGSDDALKGDVNVIARGTLALMAQEAAQVRRNEFLQLVLNSPVAQHIVDMDGIAALLRENAKTLDMDVDKIVPNTDLLHRRLQQQAQAQAALAQQQGGSGVQPPQQPGAPGGPSSGPAAAPPAVFPNPAPQGATSQPGASPGAIQHAPGPSLGRSPMTPTGAVLPTGRPATDHFSPPRRP